MLSPSQMERLAEKLLSPEMKEKLADFHFEDAGHGYDAFGLHPAAIQLGIGLCAWVYENYFRVISEGSEHIPSYGPAILAANHSGNLPIDGAMMWNDVLRNTNPPRVARGIADHFVPALPFIGTLFTRAGMVGGSAGNVRALLDQGDLLMIFPEGVPGIIKPWELRYQLQKFRVGHAQLAIQHSCPIIPVGIVGAEEQLPSIFSSKTLGKMLGISAVPIPMVPVPLPVRYRIYYGEPIPIQERYSPEEADDPDILALVAKEVKGCVHDLIQKGLKERVGIFR